MFKILIGIMAVLAAYLVGGLAYAILRASFSLSSFSLPGVLIPAFLIAVLLFAAWKLLRGGVSLLR